MLINQYTDKLQGWGAVFYLLVWTVGLPESLTAISCRYRNQLLFKEDFGSLRWGDYTGPFPSFDWRKIADIICDNVISPARDSAMIERIVFWVRREGPLFFSLDSCAGFTEQIDESPDGRPGHFQALKHGAVFIENWSAI